MVVGSIARPLGRWRGFRESWHRSWAAARASLMWGLLGRQKQWVRWLVLLLFGYFGAQSLVAIRMVSMVDAGIVNQTAPLGPYVSQILLLTVVSLLIDFAGRQVLARIGYQIEMDVRVALYEGIQTAELRRLDALATGQLVTRSLTDLQLLQQILSALTGIVTLLPLVPVAIIVLFFFSPPMAVVTVAALPINLWLVKKLRNRLWGLSWAELNERAEVAKAIDEPVRGIRVVKAFGGEEYERQRVRNATDRTYRFSMSRARLLARYDLPIKFIPIFFQAVVVFIGARLAISGGLSIGTFLLSFQAISFVTMIATSLNELASAWQYLRSSQSRLGEVLALGAEPLAAGVQPGPPTTGLELRDVSLGFGVRPVLEGLSLRVRYRELVVLSGGPSSGKTTVAGLAAGLLTPDSGQVVLDGVDVNALDPTEARRCIRIVSEEPFLFATTVRENLELGADHKADDATILAAVRAAGAEDIVAELPEGLDSHIGDRGLTLSGGQRQRLSLARALVHPPRVLVLDDALAAVNPSLEMEILERIRAHAPATAILCITRRPSLAALADRTVRLPTLAAAAEATEAIPEQVEEPVGFGPLDQELTGIVAGLDLSPELPRVPEAVMASDRPPRVVTLVRVFKMLLLVGWIVLLLQSATDLIPQLLFGSVADLVHNHNTRQTDIRSLALVLIAAGAAVTAYAFRMVSSRFTQSFVYTLRRSVFHRLSRLGIDFYDRELPGEVAARVVNDLDTTLLFLQRRAFDVLAAAATFVVGMSMMGILSPAVIPLVVILVLATLVITIAQAPMSERAFAWARTELGRVVAKFEEDYAARRDIQSYGAHDTQKAKFVAASLELRRARRWSLSVANAYGASLQFLSQLTALLVLWRAGNLALAGTISIGTAVALRLISTSATSPLSTVGDFLPQFLNLRVSWHRLAEPFQAPILPDERPSARACPALIGEITFDQVSFSYPHVGRTVLHDVSFRIPPGEMAALVGYTGAGKSSVAKLLARMYDPDLGAVRIDRNDVRDLDLRSYRRRLGIVPQDAFVFRGTVASNIAYGAQDSTPDRIEAAARSVGAHAILARLPGCYDHPVEEEGRNLTSAQRQLIALARAWLAGPDILVLDEATSSLDAALEENVIAAVGQLGCTTLMVTHRRRVVDQAGLVVVLDGGRVAEIGAPGELAGSGGVYDRIWAPDADTAADSQTLTPDSPAARTPGTAEPAAYRIE